MKKPLIRPPAAWAPLLAWADIAWKSFEIATAAGQVIPIRLARMAAAGTNPSAKDRREMHRMGAEKVTAFSKSGTALAFGMAPWATRAALQSIQAGVAFWSSWARMLNPWTAVTPRRRHIVSGPALRRRNAHAVARVIKASLEPVHATVTANARRLSRR